MNNVVSKAIKPWVCNKKNLSYFDEDMVRRLYTAFVRPNLEYAEAVF
jgi:hypothetical protein